MKTCIKCKISKPFSEYYFQAGRTRRFTDCKVCRNAALRNRQLQKAYGITSRDYAEMAQKQNYLCAICDENEKLVVDHDHKTGRVRGLLCIRCNGGLGLIFERVPLNRIQSYLKHD
jgi:hypothetical protein